MNPLDAQIGEPRTSATSTICRRHKVAMALVGRDVYVWGVPSARAAATEDVKGSKGQVAAEWVTFGLIRRCQRTARDFIPRVPR